MPLKCPHCDEEIEYLAYSAILSEWGTSSFDGDLDHSDSEVQEVTYECPNCNRSLGHSTDSAREKLIDTEEENATKRFVAITQKTEENIIYAKDIDEARKKAKEKIEGNENAELWHVREEVLPNTDNQN